MKLIIDRDDLLDLMAAAARPENHGEGPFHRQVMDELAQKFKVRLDQYPVLEERKAHWSDNEILLDYDGNPVSIKGELQSQSLESAQ